MPCELLSSLANCLLNETIFKIVEGLTEIQQVTEKQLLQQRLQLLHKHKGILVLILSAREEIKLILFYFILLSAEKENNKANESVMEEIIARQTAELKEADKNLIQQLDQLVTDQQSTLEKAGVPGFYPTFNAQDIQMQMYLLEFITTLGKESDLNPS